MYIIRYILYVVCKFLFSYLCIERKIFRSSIWVLHDKVFIETTSFTSSSVLFFSYLTISPKGNENFFTTINFFTWANEKSTHYNVCTLAAVFLWDFIFIFSKMTIHIFYMSSGFYNSNILIYIGTNHFNNENIKKFNQYYT